MTDTHTSDDVPLLEQQLCFSVYAAAHAFSAAYKPLLTPFGLTYTQYLVLLVLWQRDGISVKEIAERLRLDGGTLSPLLKRLEAAGHVRRRRDPADERHLRVELTEQGSALRGKVGGARKGIVSALKRSETQIQELKRQIDQLVPLLEDASE